MGNYYDGKVSMKPDMSKMDYICEDEYSFEVPEVYFESTGEENEKNVFDWNSDSILVVKNKRVIKYTDTIFSKILLKDTKGKTEWLDGRIANILGVDVDDAEDIRESKEYRIEEYDLEKSQKRIYKVVLDETVDMSDIDICEIKRIIEEKNND